MSTPAKRKINVHEARAILHKSRHAVAAAADAAEHLEALKALGPVPALREKYGDQYGDAIANQRALLRGALK